MTSPNKAIFLMTMVSGTAMAVSSSSWFMSWLGLELNLISFIPLIFSEKNAYSSESAFKYFLIQTVGSALILTSAATTTLGQSLSEKIILVALLLKMGAAPLHFWLPAIMQGLSWGGCLVLMTLQKIAPMAMLLYTLSEGMNELWVGASVLSAILGGLGGLNQTLLRKILAYSSISHMGWMLAALGFDSSQWKLYLIIYSFTSISLIIVLSSIQIYHTNQLLGVNSTPTNMIGIFLTLFSLGGLPPLLGFLPKLSVISLLTSQTSILWAFMLVMSSLLTLYFYTRLLITALTMGGPKLSPASFKFSMGIAVITFLNLLLINIPLYY